MPATAMLIVCKVILGAPDANSEFTGHIDSEWDMTGGVMHCRAQTVQLYDPAVDMGAAPQPFNTMACMRTVMMLGPQFDVQHKDKPWRFWRGACPTPIYPDADVDGKPDPGSAPVGWKIPECPRKDGMVECEGGSEI